MKPAFFICICFFYCTAWAQKDYTVQSPDGKITVTVQVGDKLRYSVKHENDQVIIPSTISMKLTDGQLGVNPRLKNVKQLEVNQVIDAPFYKRKKITDHYRELTLNFKGDYSLILRAYNDGVAYRFALAKKDDVIIEAEEATFNFSGDYESFIPYVNSDKRTFEEQFFNSFENTYTHTRLSGIDAQRLMFLPLVVELPGGKKVCLTEADLEAYPGMYLTNTKREHSLNGMFAHYPKKTEQGGHNQLQLLVRDREPYMAKVKGTRNFPWRAIIISSSDKELADNDMVYKLASPSRLKDTSWIKPGKVAWDWWNAWNIDGVDFKAGINNQTYQYYIDFAAEHGIEYVILDEGWAVNLKADLMQVVPQINIEELVNYGKKKNVGIILWAGYAALDRDLENICKHYSTIGVKGFKIDFMDRDDQVAVDFYYRVAETTARYKMMADFHGAYKPTGLQRTYPNVINFEGVHGLEQLKWSDPGVDMVKYDVTIPFIRMAAGPMDYTQGAMRNAAKGNYRPINSEPMSQGTRCHQLGEYVVFESPLNMLCDSPSAYKREEECTKFIAGIPTTWDNTRALDGKVGEYVIIARQKGDVWYVGALTNWTARELNLDLSFLGDGNFQLELFKDGANADRIGRDYKHEVLTLDNNKTIKISLAPGGGFAGRIFKQ